MADVQQQEEPGGAATQIGPSSREAAAEPVFGADLGSERADTLN